MKKLLIALLCMMPFIGHAQQRPEEKLMMSFYALRSMYIDSVDVQNRVEMQMYQLLSTLDPHSEYLSAQVAAANEYMLLTPTAGIADGDETIEGKMVDKNTGVVTIKMFHQTTDSLFRLVADSLVRLGMKDMVLDIRGNGGGFFDTALSVADELLPSGLLMSTARGLNTPQQEFTTQKPQRYAKLRVVVLVDEDTMSAAEIFASVLQDWDRAVIVGRRTFGKAMVQETLPFADGSAIRISVANIYAPSGRSIQRPYRGMSHKDYFDEPKRRAADGSLPAEVMQAKYKSMVNGRTLYGQSGVNPDVFVADTDQQLNRAIALLGAKGEYEKLLKK